MQDLTSLTDDALADLLNAVLNEQERRQRLATIPATIADLAQQYVAGGGDPAIIEQAITT